MLRHEKRRALCAAVKGIPTSASSPARSLSIHDNDPTHTAAKTRDYLAGNSGWWRSRFTRPRLVARRGGVVDREFGYHYLKRGSWHSRAGFVDYVGQAWPEYNRLYAHPFEMDVVESEDEAVG